MKSDAAGASSSQRNCRLQPLLREGNARTVCHSTELLPFYARTDIIFCYHRQMKSKHARTLKAIFTEPTLVSIVFADLEALVLAVGGEVREGAGSRVVFELTSSPP